MITKVTFKCDNCSNKKTVSIPTKKGKNLPSGWKSLRGVGFRVEVCSEKCRREYSVTHALGYSEDEDRPGPRLVRVREMPQGLRQLLDAITNGDSEEERKGLEDALKGLAKEFDVPVEIVEEFAKHVRNTPCPHCEAAADEHCRAQEDDDQRHCPLHGPEMIQYAHKERIAEAKKTWRSKAQ